MAKLHKGSLAARDYLRDKWNIEVSISWLDKARLTGDGPDFRKLAGKIYYEDLALDHWVENGKIRGYRV